MWGQVLVFRMWRWVGCITHIWALAWPELCWRRAKLRDGAWQLSRLSRNERRRREGERRAERNVAEASVLVISSLMNIINLPFNEQNMKILLFVDFVSSLLWKYGLLRWMFGPRLTKSNSARANEYLLHIYNNWPLTGSAVCQSAPHIADHVWLRLRLSPGDHYRKCRSLEVCIRRFDTLMLGTNIFRD